jgi:transposase
LGVETFSTLAREDGGFDAIANPRFFKKHRESVERAQKHLEATPKDSPQRRAAKIALGRAKGRETNQRYDFPHQTTAAVIARVALLATEKLGVKCGCVLTRDQNGARVNLRWALSNLGQELARNAIPYPLAGWRG